MMQPNAVLFVVLPSIGTDFIEGKRELLKRLSEGLSLFWRRIQLYSYSSVHTKKVPYMLRNCNSEKGEAWGVLQHAAFPPLG